MWLPIAAAHSQELEYLMDIGGGTGLCFYMGDANSTPFSHSSMMASVNFRRIFNPRMAIKTNFAFGRFGGTTTGRYIPTDPNDPTGTEPLIMDFSSNVIDAGTQFELNFWGFGSGPSYKGMKRFTPYILAGLGITLGMARDVTSFGVNFPVGAGVKYKVKPRLNIGLEWTFRFSTSDRLDSKLLCDPYGIKSGFLKNKDTYSFLEFFVSYEICPKLRKCNN